MPEGRIPHLQDGFPVQAFTHIHVDITSLNSGLPLVYTARGVHVWGWGGGGGGAGGGGGHVLPEGHVPHL